MEGRFAPGPPDERLEIAKFEDDYEDENQHSYGFRLRWAPARQDGAAGENDFALAWGELRLVKNGVPGIGD